METESEIQPPAAPPALASRSRILDFGFRVLRSSPLLSLIVLLAFASGCARSREEAGYPGFVGGVFFPEPPPFLSGPMAVVLTNNAGFSARLRMETSSISARPEVVAGELLGRGSLLFFAPEPSQFPDKRSRKAGLSFIWDVQENRGYMLSEALQGYAPIAFNVRYTNVTVSAGVFPPQRISGHHCSQELVTVASNEGSTASFQVWRAADLKGFPIRITTGTNGTPLTLTFSKLRFEAPPNELFKPPEGFTKYDSPDSMMGELTMRQHHIKRPGTGDWTQPEPPGSRAAPQLR